MRSEILTDPSKSKRVNTFVPDLSIVLVCWNNRDYLGPCLDSIFESGLQCDFNIVVVDNGSTDGSQEMLRTNYPDVTLIQNDRNVGLGMASNQGIQVTNGRHILLLNNDTLVNSSSLDAMVAYLDHNSDVAAVGGKLLNPDGTVQSCYNKFPTLIEEFLIATRIGEYLRPGYPANISDSYKRSVDWMCSACIMIRRAALNEVGLLDEEYFIYGDELDLQYRLKKAGWRLIFLPQATTVHYGGRSMNRWSRRKMVYRGHMLFYKKNYGRFRSLILRIMLGCLSMAKLFIWSTMFVIPSRRVRAQKELTSNYEVIKLCWNLA